MESLIVSGLKLLALTIIGLIVLTLGIVYIVKNIKWKKQKQMQGLSVGNNIVGIIIFSVTSFFSAIWVICFCGAGIMGIILGLFLST